MKIAVIDMGTNTFHLLIAKVTKDTHSILSRERLAVKIGEKGINKNEITPSAWQRGLTALHTFKRKMEQEQIKHVFATATSAVRNAQNGQAFANQILNETGIEVDIISGKREAELIYLGAQKAISFENDHHLVMDIGGGSIEFIIGDGEKIHWLQSFEIGGQRLVELFHHHDPIITDEIAALENHFEKNLQPLFAACEKHRPVDLVGCSGTFDTLSDIYCRENNIEIDHNIPERPFTKEAFEAIHEQLITFTKAERLAIPGMIEMRVEMIVVASILINYLTKRLSFSKVRVSSFALKEGILFETLNTIRTSMLSTQA
ncbi:MAG: exopolyphosphatase [Bacteroidota bacterium]